MPPLSLAPEIVIPSADAAASLSRVLVSGWSLAPESLPGRLLLRHRRDAPDSPDPDRVWLACPPRRWQEGKRGDRGFHTPGPPWDTSIWKEGNSGFLYQNRQRMAGRNRRGRRWPLWEESALRLEQSPVRALHFPSFQIQISCGGLGAQSPQLFDQPLARTLCRSGMTCDMSGPCSCPVSALRSGMNSPLPLRPVASFTRAVQSDQVLVS